jgi:hypothetical protein
MPGGDHAKATGLAAEALQHGPTHAPPLPADPSPGRALRRHGLGLALEKADDMPTPPGGLSLDLDQRIDARFGDEQILAVHLQHHKPVLVKSDQAPPLGLRLSPSVGVQHQVGSVKHEHPSPSLTHRATVRLTEGAAGVARIPDRCMLHSLVCEAR